MHYDIYRFLNFKTSAKIASCLSLVALADILFYDHSMGWTLGLFCLCLLSLSVLHNFRRVITHPATLAAGVSAFLLALAQIESANAFNFTLCASTLFSLALLLRQPAMKDIRRLLISPFGPLLSLRYAYKTSVLLAHVRKRSNKLHARKGAFIWYWLMPCVFSALFIGLFAAANPVLTSWLNSVNWEAVFRYLSPLRILYWLCVGSACWAIIRPKLSRLKMPAGSNIPSQDRFTLIALLFNDRSIRTALILFNILFAFQNGMDVAIRLGVMALPPGLTYAEYAHQGAYPLIATALLAALFVLIALKPGASSEGMPLIRLLVYVWIAQNIFLVASSIARLSAYIEEFSLTYLRIWALIWMVLVGVGLALIVARIYLGKSNLWLINTNGIALYATLCLCCFINYGRIIADYNVTHCSQVTGKGAVLDLDYLALGVGEEAIPALLWYREHAPNSSNSVAVRDTAVKLNAELTTDLSDWRQWTFRNYRLARELQTTCRGKEELPMVTVRNFRASTNFIMAKSILVADDDSHIREVLAFALEKAGFRTESAQHGKEALDKHANGAFDLIVLDINMPEMDGLEVCRRIRKTSEIPILFLSSRDEEIDRIVGIEIGGDDYLTKPFSPRELVARVQAILKRAAPKPMPVAAETLLHKGALAADMDNYTVSWQGSPVPLTATEFQLLVVLLKRPAKVFQREELMDSAYAGIHVSDRTIDSHIRRIRQKFGCIGAPGIIETVHGVGYKLGPCQ